MRKWELLTSEIDIASIAKDIRKICERKPYSNCEALFQNGSDRLRKESCYCLGERNLSIIEPIDGIYFIYYYWGDVDKVFVPAINEKGKQLFVCEIIEIEGRERQEEIVYSLKKQGFVQYKNYYKWKLARTSLNYFDSDVLSYKMEYDEGLKKALYDTFDSLGDMLPAKERFEEYISEASVLLAYEKKRLVGGVVFHIKGKIVEEDYIFTFEAERGKGYAKHIQSEFIKYCFDEINVNKVNAWIEENNIKSIELHKECGFVQTRENKKTYVRGLNDVRKGIN